MSMFPISMFSGPHQLLSTSFARDRCFLRGNSIGNWTHRTAYRGSTQLHQTTANIASRLRRRVTKSSRTKSRTQILCKENFQTVFVWSVSGPRDRNAYFIGSNKTVVTGY